MERDEPRLRILSKLARSSALAPFRIRNYRFQWPADLFTSWAFEMETLVLGWYVFAETGSVVLLTVVASLNYTGTLIAPMFGVVGDRIGHRVLGHRRIALAIRRRAPRALHCHPQCAAHDSVLRPRQPRPRPDARVLARVALK